MPHRRFPLPQGHVYAGGLKPNRHDGSKGTEGLWLLQAQLALKIRWKFGHVVATGKLDAATQDAIVRIQHAHGYVPNGELDERTWDTIFVGEPQ